MAMELNRRAFVTSGVVRGNGLRGWHFGPARRSRGGRDA